MSRSQASSSRRPFVLICALAAGAFTGCARLTELGAAESGGCVTTPCPLLDSGPVVVSASGTVVENLRIVSNGSDAVTVVGHADVVIRNCELHHQGGAGIRLDNAPGARVENVLIVRDGAPASGPLPSLENNIDVSASPDVVITRVKLTSGSAGIYVLDSPRAWLSFIEGHDFRGPFPRGQLVQLDKSDDSVLEDFSSECGSSSWTEDNVSIYHSSAVTVRRGLVRGNNSPNGSGVKFIHTTANVGGLVEDVDAVEQGNGCFSAEPGFNVVFRRTRARDNLCGDQGRGAPSSNALVWSGAPTSSGLRVEASSHFNLCNPSNLLWDGAVFTVQELSELDFVPRPPIRLAFPWLP